MEPLGRIQMSQAVLPSLTLEDFELASTAGGRVRWWKRGNLKLGAAAQQWVQSGNDQETATEERPALVVIRSDRDAS